MGRIGYDKTGTLKCFEFQYSFDQRKKINQWNTYWNLGYVELDTKMTINVYLT